MGELAASPSGSGYPLEGFLPSKQEASIKGGVMWRPTLKRVPTSLTPVEVQPPFPHYTSQQHEEDEKRSDRLGGTNHYSRADLLEPPAMVTLFHVLRLTCQAQSGEGHIYLASHDESQSRRQQWKLSPSFRKSG